MATGYEARMEGRGLRPFRTEGRLPDDLLLRAERELGEREATREGAIVALRKLVKGDSKLHCCTDDAYLLQYLRARKFNLKKAHTLLQNFYIVKKSYPELYTTPDLPLLRQIWKTGAVAWLPYRDREGCPVLMFHINLWDTEKYTFADLIKAITVALIFGAEVPETQITGIRVFVDMQDTSLKQFRQIMSYIYLLSRAFTNCLPLRFKGIHFYNETVWFKYFYKVFRILLTEKIKKRVFVHGNDQDQLHKIIPKVILPAEYGGENDIHSSATWFPKEIENYDDRIVELYGYSYQR